MPSSSFALHIENPDTIFTEKHIGIIERRLEDRVPRQQLGIQHLLWWRCADRLLPGIAAARHDIAELEEPLCEAG